MKNFKYYLISLLIIFNVSFSFSMNKNKKKNKNCIKNNCNINKTEKYEDILESYKSMPEELKDYINRIQRLNKFELPEILENKLLKLDNKSFHVAFSIILNYVNYVKDIALLSDAEYFILNQLISLGIATDSKFFKLDPILCLSIHISQVKGLINSIIKYLEKAKKKYNNIVKSDPNNYQALYILLKVTVLLMHYNQKYDPEIVSNMIKKLYNEDQFIFYEAVMPFNLEDLDILEKLINNLVSKYKIKETIYLLSSICFSSLSNDNVKLIIYNNSNIKSNIAYILDEVFSKKLKTEVDYLLIAYFYNLIGQNNKALKYTKFLLDGQENKNKKLFFISMLRDCFNKDEISSSIERYTKINKSLINKIG